MNTTENNKIIAEFMGMKQDPKSGNYMLPHYSSKYVINHLTKGRNYDEWADKYTDENYNTGYLLPLDYLDYDSSFDWLMKVVEKIESVEKPNTVIIGATVCYINAHDKYTNELVQFKTNDNTKIEAVYNACVKFIEWYNEQKSA